jgi:DNA-binding protein H-NS
MEHYMQLANTVTEKREVTLDVLSNKNSIRNMLSEVDMHDVEKLYKRITDVVEELREIEKAKLAEEETKKKALQEIKAQLEAKGFSADDLVDLLTGRSTQSSASLPKKKRNVKEQPKFHFNYKVDGEDKVYFGKIGGRKPDDFTAYLKDNMMTLDDVVTSEDREAYLKAKAQR